MVLDGALLLNQQKVLSLPKFTAKGASVSKQVVTNFINVFRDGDLWESEDFVSLDPRSSPPDRYPEGVGRLLSLLTWDDYKKEDAEVEDADVRPTQRIRRARLAFALKWLGRFILAAFFAVLPTALIMVLYVIPTSHKRLWAILGESVFLVCALTVWKTKSSEKLDILTYMLG